MDISLSPFAPEDLVCETLSTVVPSRVSLLNSILGLNLVLTYEIPPVFRGDKQVITLLFCKNKNFHQLPTAAVIHINQTISPLHGPLEALQ